MTFLEYAYAIQDASDAHDLARTRVLITAWFQAFPPATPSRGAP